MGEYAKDKREGKGVSYFADGRIRYAGDWVDGQPHGMGILHLPNGMRFGNQFHIGFQFHDDVISDTKESSNMAK